MNEAPSIAIVSGCSSALSNTSSPVLFSKSATRMDTGSIGFGAAFGVVRRTTTAATPIVATMATAAAVMRQGDITPLGTRFSVPSASRVASAAASSALV